MIRKVILVLSISLNANADHFIPDVIYGSDSRREVPQDQKHLEAILAKKVVVLVDKKKFTPYAPDLFELNNVPYGSELKLCTSERFWYQKSPGFCSGVFIDPTHILTSGHCFDEKNTCSKTAFVVDFNYVESSTRYDLVSSENIFNCDKIEKLVVTEKDEDLDYAIVRIDRPVEGFRVAQLPINTDQFKEKRALLSIGHPEGLPAKVVDGHLRHKYKNGMWNAAIDTYKGNSGSPVFDPVSGELLAIVSAGEEDYEQHGKCSVSKRCAEESCMGETLIPISEISF